MPPLIYPENSDDKESLTKPLSAETDPELGTPSKKNTEEPTSEPNHGDLSEPYTPTGGGVPWGTYPQKTS